MSKFESQYLPAVEGLMHLAPACSLWLGLGVIFMEWGRMMEENAFQLVMNKPWMYALAAAMGFMVNLLAYMVIQTSSSLTLKVLGTVKNALVVWIGVVFLGDIITGLQVKVLVQVRSNNLWRLSDTSMVLNDVAFTSEFGCSSSHVLKWA